MLRRVTQRENLVGPKEGKDDGARGIASRIPGECLEWSINNNHAICSRIAAREFASRALIGAAVVTLPFPPQSFPGLVK